MPVGVADSVIESEGGAKNLAVLNAWKRDSISKSTIHPLRAKKVILPSCNHYGSKIRHWQATGAGKVSTNPLTSSQIRMTVFLTQVELSGASANCYTFRVIGMLRRRAGICAVRWNEGGLTRIYIFCQFNNNLSISTGYSRKPEMPTQCLHGEEEAEKQERVTGVLSL